MTKHRPPLSDPTPPAPFTREQEVRIVELIRDILHDTANEEARYLAAEIAYNTKEALALAIKNAGFTEVAKRRRNVEAS